MMAKKIRYFELSTEELVLAFSMFNRPDLGKAVLYETFGDLLPQVIEERLKAASHSLLVHNYANIDEKGTAILSEDIQTAFLPMVTFEGIIQMVINENGPIIMNTHLGLRGDFTSHWIEQGVVHHITFGPIEELPSLISDLALLPSNTSSKLKSEILKERHRIDMETFANLPEMGFEQGLEILKKIGFSPALSNAFLTDIHHPKKRGSVSYLDINPQNIEKHSTQNAVAGLFFQIGEFGWIIVFPKNEKQQTGNLINGTSTIFKEKVHELIQKRSLSFVE